MTKNYIKKYYIQCSALGMTSALDKRYFKEITLRGIIFGTILFIPIHIVSILLGVKFVD